jgi:hypothetical protein
MRSAALSLLLGSICPLAAVGAPDDATDPPHTNIRKELLAEYKFEATTRDPTLPAPLLANASAAPQDPNLVEMAPYTVRETPKMNALNADIVAQEASARTEAITRKLGIGMHVAPLGPVGLYAVTVFYIPVQVGFGFSF